MKTALTIAGSDCSGGAGIQADLKTFAAHGVYGMSVITALTAQNTTGVFDVAEAPTNNLAAQLDSVFSDIFPDAVKIGMLSSANVSNIVADKLEEYKPKFVVLDPVMVSTSGHKLISDDAEAVLTNRLFSLSTLITPNLNEAEVLCGYEISTREEMRRAAERIAEKYSVNVLLKGGHLENRSDDLLMYGGEAIWLEGKRIDNPNTHGTGCTLSSAIAANLALGHDLKSAVKNAKQYVTGAIAAGLKLGHGRGPLNHLYKYV